MHKKIFVALLGLFLISCLQAHANQAVLTDGYLKTYTKKVGVFKETAKKNLGKKDIPSEEAGKKDTRVESGINNKKDDKKKKQQNTANANPPKPQTSYSFFSLIKLVGIVLIVLIVTVFYGRKKRRQQKKKYMKKFIPTPVSLISHNNEKEKPADLPLEEKQGTAPDATIPTSNSAETPEIPKTPEISEIVTKNSVTANDEQTAETKEEEKEPEPIEKEETVVNTEPFVLKPEEGKCLAIDVDDWIVVGASVQGNGHIRMKMPCQDNHGYKYLSDGWGIAITSDGAGSARLSHIGSAAVVSRAMVHFKELIDQKEWKKSNNLPSDMDWMKCSYQTLNLVHKEIAALAQHNECEPKDLNATIIVVIHSPLGLLVVHVGDGRAGYKDMEGNWHSLITPHKGEEANQTIFMQSGFWKTPFFEMSGVMVPESAVLREPVSAFTLMSDGCESTSWLCNQYNEETSKYYDPNMPFAKFFNPLVETLQSFREDNVSLEERREKWYHFIKEGNKAFVKETDDKTMLLATMYQ